MNMVKDFLFFVLMMGSPALLLASCGQGDYDEDKKSTPAATNAPAPAAPVLTEPAAAPAESPSHSSATPTSPSVSGAPWQALGWIRFRIDDWRSLRWHRLKSFIEEN